MPCDTRIQTSVVDLAKVDQGRLASVLEADDWVVTRMAGDLRASRDACMLVVASGRATLFSPPWVDASELHASIRRAYAARTVTDVSARFGFKLQGREQLLGGAQRLMLRR
jgi:hypothetical protein